MKRQILGYLTVIVILSNCLICTANSKYAIGNIDDIINKRRYQRRNLLESFCARRCNIGKGGNVCRCNGFHFAGKRSGYLADSDSDSPGGGAAQVANLYGALSDAETLLLGDQEDRYTGGLPGVPPGGRSGGTEDINTSSLNTMISELLRGKLTSTRAYDAAVKELLDSYLAPADSDTTI